MKIPLVDLHAQYLSIKAEIDQAIEDTIQNTAFIGGNAVQEFEREFAQLIGTRHCIGCANGTDAIEILLQAMGIGKGDEVIVPAISWISTSEAVSTVGAKPVFVDVEEQYFTIDPTLIESKITACTRAIIPVHLYGHPANMDEIMRIAQKHNLLVLEDCAQAHLAEWGGKKIGTWGDAASFSFFPGKNLGAYGDAGGMITNEDKIARRARLIANHGQEGKHNHLIEGRNSRLDGLQSAILNVKLPFLEGWTAARIQKAAYYNSNLPKSNLKLPKIHHQAKSVFHLYVIRTPERDGLMQFLKEKGIACAVHYPEALPFLTCYADLERKAGDFPVAHSAVREILSIPLYPELSKPQMDFIVDSINKYFKR